MGILTSPVNCDTLLIMKKDLHPTYYEKANIKCACGNSIAVGSTVEKMSVEVCSNCHPFYTGKKRIVDTAGKVEKFEARLKKAKEMQQKRKEIVKKPKRIQKSQESKEKAEKESKKIEKPKKSDKKSKKSANHPSGDQPKAGKTKNEEKTKKNTKK